MSDGTFSIIAGFLTGIGLPVEIGENHEPTFLPGIHAAHGILRVDPARLAWPGDLLHEAGHLALLPAQRRREIAGSVGDDGGEELGAIAWSYAAAIHLQLDPAVVFHEGGYHGGSSSLLQNFAAGRYVGLPMLQWLGLCADARIAEREGCKPYPHMRHWLRPE